MRCNCTMARILTSSSSSLLSAESENCSMRHTPTVVLRDRRLVDCVLRYIALFVRIGTDFSFVMKEWPLASAVCRLILRTRRNYISIICTRHISCRDSLHIGHRKVLRRCCSPSKICRSLRGDEDYVFRMSDESIRQNEFRSMCSCSVNSICIRPVQGAHGYRPVGVWCFVW